MRIAIWIVSAVLLLVAAFIADRVASTRLLAELQTVESGIGRTDGSPLRYPVWVERSDGATPPADGAVLLAAEDALFGARGTYELPGERVIDCWVTPMFEHCTAPYTLKFRDGGG